MLAPRLATARSTLPSPLKSAAATALGARPTATVVAGAKRGSTHWAAAPEGLFAPKSSAPSSSGLPAQRRSVAAEDTRAILELGSLFARSVCLATATAIARPVERTGEVRQQYLAHGRDASVPLPEGLLGREGGLQ